MSLFFWFDLFLEARAEIQKYFHSFFGANENFKNSIEINWPLVHLWFEKILGKHGKPTMHEANKYLNRALRDHPYITSAKTGWWVQKMTIFADVQYCIYAYIAGGLVRKRPQMSWRNIGMVPNLKFERWHSSLHRCSTVAVPSWIGLLM
jgi:hypothetical protein